MTKEQLETITEMLCKIAHDNFKDDYGSTAEYKSYEAHITLAKSLRQGPADVSSYVCGFIVARFPSMVGGLAEISDIIARD